VDIIQSVYWDHMSDTQDPETASPEDWGRYDDFYLAPCVNFATSRVDPALATKAPATPKAAASVLVLPGELERSKSRVTGTVNSLIDAEESPDFNSEEGGRWITFCNDHGQFVQHTSRSVAHGFRPRSDEWCSVCQANQEPA
jgi:hypothetical protein